ncbi:MAG: TlpA family protein disulfide reductase [Myxococcales bacterium]|nr:TlpA family protein disulfide reductase [Myxococcales bacterium]
MTALFALLACMPEPPPLPEPPPAPAGVRSLAIQPLVDELSAPRQRPRVYNFWATWCGPCLAELPALRQFGRAHPEVDVVFVNVDMPSLLDTRVKPTVARMDLEGFEHIALDSEDPAYALNRVQGWPNSVPVTLVVSSTGERVKQFNTRVDERILTHALSGVH